MGAGPIGLLDVVPHMASSLLQDLFAVDTQMGSVTSLTAGEQGWRVGQPGQGRDWSSSMWGSTLGHSAPLTVPQPLLTVLRGPCLCRTLTQPADCFLALLCSLCPGIASARPPPYFSNPQNSLLPRSARVFLPSPQTSGRGTSANPGRRSPGLAPSSSSYPGLMILHLKCF